MQRLFLGYEGKNGATPAWMNSSITRNGTTDNNSQPPIVQKDGTTSFVLQVSDDMLRSLDQKTKKCVTGYMEVWDYVGGASFRGFIAEKKNSKGEKERSLFLFFEQGVEATELKPGLVALLDLAIDCFDCQNLVVCLDRQLDGLDSFVHDLGWVGLEPITLKYWSHENPSTTISSESKLDQDQFISDKWLFLGMEL